MGCTERRVREKEIIKANILTAALQIAKSEGWHSLTIRKIADAIEYAPPIIYEHFENKEALIQQLILSGYQTLNQETKKALAENLSPDSHLRKLSLVHWDFAFSNRELYRLMFSIERPKPNEEGLKGMMMIHEVFSQLTHKTDSELKLLIFNWICLLNGTIGIIMNIEDSKSPRPPFLPEPREMFLQFIDRFISSLN
jgi:AcrR family transcriptional regulator